MNTSGPKELLRRTAHFVGDAIDRAGHIPDITDEQMAAELGMTVEEFTTRMRVYEVATATAPTLNNEPGGRNRLLAIPVLLAAVGGVVYGIGEAMNMQPTSTDLKWRALPLPATKPLTPNDLVDIFPSLTKQTVADLTLINRAIDDGLKRQNLVLPGPKAERQNGIAVLEGPTARTVTTDQLVFLADGLSQGGSSLTSDTIMGQLAPSITSTEQQILGTSGPILAIPDVDLVMSRLEQSVMRPVTPGQTDLVRVKYDKGERTISLKASEAVLEAWPEVMTAFCEFQRTIGAPLPRRIVGIGSGSKGYPEVEVIEGQVTRLLSDTNDAILEYDITTTEGAEIFVKSYLANVRALKENRLDGMLNTTMQILQLHIADKLGYMVDLTKLGDMMFAAVRFEPGSGVVNYSRWLTGLFFKH